MKNGRSLVSLAQELERQLHSKKDLIVPSTLVRHATDDLGGTRLVIEEGGSPAHYGVTPLARRQLADKLKIPYAYFERMREDQPALLDRNVNTWLQSEEERRMLRTLDGQVPVLFNWTPSLPYRIAWLVHGPHPLRRGDFIVFSFDGEAKARYPGLRGQPFFKIVRGLPGDAVTVAGRHVAINGEEVGVAKLQAYDHSPLAPITPTVIPPGHYYVQGTSPDSFDSRYQDSGLVRAEQVVGVVVPLY